jgi:hypothetical protein
MLCDLLKDMLLSNAAGNAGSQRAHGSWCLQLLMQP